MPGTRLAVTRAQILAFRRRAGALDERLPPGPESLRQAAWAGLQDSMPRAALLSIHARVAGTGPAAWEDPSLVQLWGPRFAIFVIAARDLAVFSLALLPDAARRRHRAEDLAGRLAAAIGGARVLHGQAGDAVGVRDANQLKYAAATGTVLIRWEGARQAVIWIVPRPPADPRAARLELTRRYLHVYGPATPEAFGRWSAIGPRAAAAFDALGGELVPVQAPAGPAWILASDEPGLRAAPGPAAPARLLPSGDAYYLLHGTDRDFLVPDPGRRDLLWTSRVWPGALLVGGEITGTWRRGGAVVDAQPWRRLTAAERDAVEAEAASLPLPGSTGLPRVRWDESVQA